ncbi:hypothetical protein GCK72_011488 [Caenorhabditis remanei]|uniref:Uncharacterized protein n=1 Tax=Caenorhabditis remanei TaxID=31234 RepID=A0A6A5H9Z4_CAERE|nr:hypothetical protein GCK72_011488 [Caenorhabditis remanei]KAF1763222.1 hypothetical protein GCK72_011488 [Caenorhabditis remanei]
MKLLSFLLFGFFAVVKLNGLDIDEQDYLIEQLNDIRRDVARLYNIENMQKLMWSKRLQNEADQLDIQKMPVNPPWRYVFYKNYTEKKDERDLTDSIIANSEHLNPQQNEIACAKKNGQNFTVICLLGPQNSLSKITKYQRGQAKCTGQLKVEWRTGHLCTTPDFTESWILMYISELNDRRKMVARTKNITNMQNLVWNKELNDAAWDFLWPSRNPNDELPKDRKWRLTGFDNLAAGLVYNPTSNRVASFNTTDGKEVTFRLDEEHFNPLQSKIACLYRPKLRKNTNYWCLLGPEDSDAGIAPPPTTQAPLDAQVTTPPTVSTVTSSATSRPMRTRYTTEKITPEPPPTQPKELEEYEEQDGDEYDEDFPTGKPYHYDF